MLMGILGAICIVVISNIIISDFRIVWQEMKKDGYIEIGTSNGYYKGTIWKRDFPSRSPSDSSIGIPRWRIPATIIEYKMIGKRLLKEDREFKEKYVYGKSIKEANQVYGLE